MAEATAMRNNALPYPIYGAPFTIVFPFRDADGDLVSAAGTPDAEISKNGDTAADCTNESTEIATNSGVYYLSLTGTELTCDIAAILGKSAASGMKTAVAVLYPRKLVTIRSGTSASGGASTSTIVLDASASAVDDFYNGMVCIAVIDSNVEVRVITDYVGSTQTATVSPDWNVAPDNNDTFDIRLTEGPQLHQANTTAWNGAAVAAPHTAGYPAVTIKDGTGTGEVDTTSGGVLVAAIAANAITATAIASDAITDAKVHSDVTIASVTGAVGSVTSGVTVTTNNDKTGYALSVAGVQAIWDALTSALTTVGSIGKRLADNVDAAITSRMATYTQPAGFLAATFPGTVASTTNITAGTITTATNVTTVNGLAAGVITETSIAANAITDAKVASDVTIASVTGAVGSVTGAVGSVTGNVTGTIGGLTAAALKDFFDTDSATTYASAVAGSVVKEIADNAGGTGLSASDIADEVETRTIAAVTTVNGLAANTVTASALATDAVTEIQSGLSTLTAAGVRTAVGLGSANLDTQLDALPTNAELATALGTADDAVLAAIAALNNLSAAGVRTAVGLATANLDTQLDALPTNAELSTALGTADDAVLSAVAALNNISAAQVNSEVDTALADVGLTGTVTGRIDAAISSRLASGSYTAPDNASVMAIKAKTDNLPIDPADASDIVGAFTTVNATLGTIAGYLDTEVAAIKTKTDSLTFVSGSLNANIKYVNDIEVTGTGETSDPWGP